MDHTDWARDISEKIYVKTLAAAERNCGRIPYIADEAGMFDDMSKRDICWWTNGFWAGMLWQLYGVRSDGRLRSCAEEIEKKLDACLLTASGMDHDSGFRWLLTSGASWRLTKNQASRNRLILAATDLAGRFNPAGSYIRAWNDAGDGKNAGVAIIDCMMNLPLLYLVSRELHDPRFRHIALAHARTALGVFLRPDGSANHIAVFDPESGRVLETLGGQGMGAGSAWTRGQSWALYGFTLSAMHTGDPDFLGAARRAADYFIRHIPASGLIPVDFCQPPDCQWEDSTAGAIASCGLIELSRLTGDAKYLSAALLLMHTLFENRCDLDPATDRILTHGSVAYHDKNHNVPIIYGDYFFTEAVLKLCGRETFLW